MLGLFILIIALVLLLCLCIIISPKAIITPQLLFVACFIPGAVYAISYVDIWDINLNQRTLFVIIGGCLLFVFVSFITSRVVNHTKKQRQGKKEDFYKLIYIEKWKLIGFAIIQILVILWLVICLLQTGYGSTISEAIYIYRYHNEDSITLPGILRELRRFCVISGYIWMYLFIHGIIIKNKNNRILLLVNIGLSVLCAVVLGARSGAIIMVVAALVQWYFLKGKAEGWRHAIDFRFVLVCVVVLFLLILGFKSFGNILGRGTKDTLDYYIAVYLSAPLKNLDTFIQKGNFNASIEEWQTLVYIVNDLGGIFGNSEWVHELNIPYLYVNGTWLGNVYTIYYAFLYDGGYAAVALFITIMALISQLSYRSATSRKYIILDVRIIIYSYITYTIAFSFFSNKFYEMIFTFTFVRQIFYMYLIRWVLLKVRVRICDYSLK